MTQGIRSWRRGRRPGLLRALARARPARLDPAAPPPVSWPPASHFTQLARSQPASSEPGARTRAAGHERPGRSQSPARPYRPLGPSSLRRKLLVAVSSALAMSAVLALAVTLAGGQAQRQARPATLGPHQRSDAPIRFQGLPLTRPWHGRVEFGVRAGVVYLTGFAIIQATSSTALTVLPPSTRPRTPLYIPVAAASGKVLTIQITPGGLVFLVSGPRDFRSGQVWLSGVSFPARS